MCRASWLAGALTHVMLATGVFAQVPTDALAPPVDAAKPITTEQPAQVPDAEKLDASAVADDSVAADNNSREDDNTTTSGKQEKGDDKKHKHHKHVIADGLSFSARVVARADVDKADDTDATGLLSLGQARVGAEYDSKRLRGEVSLELAGKAKVRDAMLAVRIKKHAWLWAGRSKVPMSAIERPSTWALPGIDRPLGSDALSSLGIIGRHEGAGITWQKRQLLAEASVHQSVTLAGDAVARPLADGAGVAMTGRVAWALPTLEVGVAAQSRETNYGADAKRYFAGALDAKLDYGPWRVWGDAFVGTSPWGLGTEGDATTWFALAQAVGGYRIGGAKRGKKYLEPFVTAAVLNPSLSRKQDWVLEASAGVNVGRWKAWRAQLGGTVREAHSLRPAGLGGVGKDFNDLLRVTLQLGAKF